MDQDAADDDEDSELIRELSELRAGGENLGRQRAIIAGLIAGWEPTFTGWLVMRYGRDQGGEIARNVVVRLVDLLVSERRMTASWRRCVWRVVFDERYAHEQERKRLKNLIDPHGDPVGVADPAAEDDLDGIFDPGRDETRLTRLLERLSERDRTVIELRVMKDRPRSEAAAILGLTVNGLDQALHRAVKHLASLARQEGVSGNDGAEEKGL